MRKKFFSVFEYFYRDASNFKAWGSLLLSGKPEKKFLQDITQKLEGGEFFIPEQLGIPPLYSEILKLSGDPTISDHSWHTFHCFRFALPKEINHSHVWGKSFEIARRFNSIEKWDFTQSKIWLDSNYQRILI